MFTQIKKIESNKKTMKIYFKMEEVRFYIKKNFDDLSIEDYLVFK